MNQKVHGFDATDTTSILDRVEIVELFRQLNSSIPMSPIVTSGITERLNHLGAFDPSGNGNKEEERKKKDLLVAAEVSANYAVYEQSKIDVKNRFADENFLEGNNWNNDFGLAASFAEGYFSIPPEERIYDDHMTAYKTGNALKENADTKEKLEQVVNDPYTRKLHNMSVFMTMRALSDPSFDLEGRTPEEVRQGIEDHLKSLPKDEFTKRWLECEQEAEHCELGCTQKEAAKKAKAFNAFEKHMLENHADSFQALRDIKDPEARQIEYSKIMQRGLQEMMGEDPESARILKDEMERFRSNENNMKDVREIYEGYLSGISRSDREILEHDFGPEGAAKLMRKAENRVLEKDKTLKGKELETATIEEARKMAGIDEEPEQDKSPKSHDDHDGHNHQENGEPKDKKGSKPPETLQDMPPHILADVKAIQTSNKAKGIAETNNAGIPATAATNTAQSQPQVEQNNPAPNTAQNPIELAAQANNDAANRSV